MPPLPHGARLSLAHRLLDSRLLRGEADVLQGHHNTNYVIRLGLRLGLALGAPPFTRAKYRVPLKTVEVVPRIWPSEAEVLEVVCRHLPEVPRCLAVLGESGERSLHRYRRGEALSERNPAGAVDERLMREFAAFFVRTAEVPVDELPPLPADWPADGDGDAFLHWLVNFTEQQVYRPNRERFGALFEALGIPHDAMARFKERHHGLASRPFALLHTDVHRANILVHRGRVAVIDWELAMYGDPLHDLATHLVRMGYEPAERARMVELWTRAMTEAGRTDLTAELQKDLEVYLAFEYAQSVYTDIMRPALDLLADAGDQHFKMAAGRVRRALGRAQQPLLLDDVLPAEEEIVEALRTWHSTDSRSGPATTVRREASRRNPSELRALRATAERISRGRCVLFDFDGPLCRLFPNGSAALADELRKVVATRGAMASLPADALISDDPQVVLRAVDLHCSDDALLAALEACLVRGEIDAARDAPATEGAVDFVRLLTRERVRLAVTTNNSPQAVAVYVDRMGLAKSFGGRIHGRTGDPKRLKPDPDCLLRALGQLGADAADAVMIGDTATDLAAAEAAGVSFMGYAFDEQAAKVLREAGAPVVITRFEDLASMIPW
ncbi:phosphotransferase [Streptomyces nigra]|uniref:phosphotransferase n=1 Tax=Streptomyces nigra TaxID=1827580 RepID=UPI001FC949A9|nr:phosphotransferase [Streptomyces nigra]